MRQRNIVVLLNEIKNQLPSDLGEKGLKEMYRVRMLDCMRIWRPAKEVRRTDMGVVALFYCPTYIDLHGWS